jgi:hypothetical protein
MAAELKFKAKKTPGVCMVAGCERKTKLKRSKWCAKCRPVVRARQLVKNTLAYRARKARRLAKRPVGRTAARRR